MNFGLLQVFHHRDFTLLWVSGVSMSVAMTLRLLISAQWLYEETGSEIQLGLLGAVQLIQLPVALYGGTLADTIDRKKLMAVTQGISFVILIVLTVLAFGNWLVPWHIFVVTGVSSIVNLLGGSARPAMLPRTVPRNLIVDAVTTQTISFQGASILAPLIFWQLFEGFGVTASLAATAIVALVSMVTPILIKASGESDGTTIRAPLSSLKQGYAFVMGHQLLPGLFLLDVGVTAVSFYRTLFPIFADHLYGLGATGTGLLGAANSTGAIIGSFAVFFTQKMQRKGLLVLIATLAYSILLIAFGINSVFVIGLVIVCLLGATDAVGMTMRQAIAQLTTPDKLLGRTSGAKDFAAMGANNIGQIEVGLVSGLIGAGGTMIIGGFVAVGAVLFIWKLIPGIARYRYDQSTDTDSTLIK
tara:strand:- start:8041 stop:9285 length:1245 start_codon:yes stop_codon:yes gene_type:complete